ncbi:MAG: GTP-binding protein [Candidatus Blackburnbacteria bacterium]|nr:GTP-binding protein [Candidatus Blackburnbacteria bacterium]
MTEKRETRPPIVVVLGHVDHGKTTLLDRIRRTNIASREAGGITQSIGAWRAKTSGGGTITFIDTPGHEVFKAMRLRGARIADVAILVVSADDGVMPQTRESLQYLREANTPFLVAITKVDLVTARPEVVENQLAQEGILLESRGGDIVGVEVSSVTGKGVEELLEMVLLLAEMVEISADPAAPLEAVVVETSLDRRRGPVVLAVVKNGTLEVGQEVGTSGPKCRIRGLFDENQRPVRVALPGTPVEILGFSTLPEVGSTLRVGEVMEVSTLGQREVVGVYKVRPLAFHKAGEFSILIKADTAGSLEAVGAQMGAQITVVYKGVGDISESDVMIARATNSPIVGFNVRFPKEVEKTVSEEGVRVYIYKIIYELLQDVEKWRKEKELAQKEKILGRAEIIAEFPHGKAKIAGCRLLEGKMARKDRLRLVRSDELLGSIRAVSLKKQRNEVDSIQTGEEFGLFFEPQLDFKVGDVVESYLPPKEVV